MPPRYLSASLERAPLAENATGAQSMKFPLLALHTLAARRGEGLRPELVSLLERSGVQSEPRKPDLGPPEGTDLLREDVKWFLTNG
jgi:hypothetical protein